MEGSITRIIVYELMVKSGINQTHSWVPDYSLSDGESQPYFYPSAMNWIHSAQQ
jgi:hypothetical protein